MLQQIAAPGGSAALFYGVNEMGFIFQQPVDRFLDHLSGILPSACGELMDTRFLLR